MADEPTTTTAPAPAPITAADPTVAALIERARNDEKKKLYSTIERLEQQLAELQKSSQNPAAPASNPTLEVQLRDLQRQLAISEEKYSALLTQEQKARAKLELDLYTERKISELRAAGTGFIPRLVTGNSAAEIDAAILESTKIYAEIHQTGAVDAEAKLKGAPLAAGSSSGPRGTVAPAPTPAGEDPNGDISAEAIAGMSSSDWATKRAQILQRAGRRT